MTANIKIAVFWNVLECRMVHGHQYFWDPCCLNFQVRRKRRQPLSSTLKKEAIYPEACLAENIGYFIANY
jgi:hypothetical protein